MNDHTESKELFSIGEVSRLFHLSTGLLRHYEKLELLKPAFTDPLTGYRYYSTQQFECLNTIRYLRSLDVPLTAIGDFLKNRDPDKMQAILLEQKQAVLEKRRKLEGIERKIDSRLQGLADALQSEIGCIRQCKKDARQLSMLRKDVMPSAYFDLEHSIREIERQDSEGVVFLGKVGVGLSAEALAQRRYRPYEYIFILLEADDAFEGERITLPEETCLTIRFRGSHEAAPPYYDQLMAYIEAHQLQITGFSKEITMIDYGLTSDSRLFVTEIQIPVK